MQWSYADVYVSLQVNTQPNGHMTFIQRLINVDATSWLCSDVNAMLYKHHVPAENGLTNILSTS